MQKKGAFDSTSDQLMKLKFERICSKIKGKCIPYSIFLGHGSQSNQVQLSLFYVYQNWKNLSKVKLKLLKPYQTNPMESSAESYQTQLSISMLQLLKSLSLRQNDSKK